MKRSLLILPALAVLTAGVIFVSGGTAADAPATTPAEAPQFGHLGRALARELDLTADQRKAIKDVVRMHQPTLRPLIDEARTERAAIHDLIVAPQLDEAALAAQADHLAATQKEIIIASAHLRADMRKILTPEQAAKLDGWRASATARAGQGRARLQQWLMEP